MNRKSFWSLIDHARAAAGGDPRRQVGTLEQALMQLTPDEVLGFDRHFCTLHARADTPGLWGAAQVIGGSCSDDGFADFRGWLIARGKRVYEQALADPDTLAGVVGADDADCQVERGFRNSPTSADRRTGSSMAPWPAPAHRTHERTGSGLP